MLCCLLASWLSLMHCSLPATCTSTQAPPAGPIPVELPDVHFTNTELRQRYGLKHVAPQLFDQEPLATERAVRWLCRGACQLLRACTQCYS